MDLALPDPIEATLDDLPPEVAAVLASTEPIEPQRETVDAAGIPISSIAWGATADRPLVLIHGVTASARIWWRVGPALAATRRRVVAVDLPGHGRTGNWRGHHRFGDNARDIAEWIHGAGLDTPELQIVGHSWGAMSAAALPRNGIRPVTLVLLDPPAASEAEMAKRASDQSDLGYRDIAGASRALSAANPAWTTEDVRAKAEAVTQVDPEAARAVLVENGDWDGGLADLSDPSAFDIDTWLIRGDPAAGGLVPDDALPAFAARLGPSHVLTIAGGAHAPHRTHAVPLVAALLRALRS